ncbi:methyltransferase domain-containing protein [Bacillaceae bacterium SIJ1]|uniref:class I SAM-dependent methyltransferase n=1 Tax=Litoribacterium kuwaitense TaxID=1398745 RepID=UPI0013EC5E49|nr:class I SAM-dependent methyltransferase [Litoribacterium kuwaitense]NGP44225.1 methyltransferase domain-containing protein [Litoribacterium kuwaitense]
MRPEPPLLQFAHLLLEQYLQPGDMAIDMTVGNGHDTVKLCKLVGPDGVVFGFDIQEKALTEAKKRLQEAMLKATLFLDSHANWATHLPEEEIVRIKAAIFNLGYLPGSDKTVITQEASTLNALAALTEKAPNALIIVVAYPGHPGGAEEKQAVQEFVESIPSTTHRALHYGLINHPSAPTIYALIPQKRNTEKQQSP